MPDFGRAWLASSAAATVLAALLTAARADNAPSYSARAKTTIYELLEGRTFIPEAGCEELAACLALLARLRDADYTVVEPDERSTRADMPGYLRARKKCPAFDPMRVSVAHRTYEATRGFAVYRLDLSGVAKRTDEILVFRAEHYVDAAAEAAEQTVLVPGMFVAMNVRGCRFLSAARAEDGDWLAGHNAIGEGDHASELLRIGERYFVLNLAPIAGPWQPKTSWWYALELWDLGPHADADRRNDKHVYSFGYKPGAAPISVRRGAPPAAPG